MSVRRACVAVLAAGGLLLTGCSEEEPLGGTSAGEPNGPPAPMVDGLVVWASTDDVPTTVEAVEGAISESGSVAATIDHAAAAADAGLELPPTTLVVGGSPEVGTPVMLAAQEAAVDLPLRFLVWEDAGQVWLAHESAEKIAAQAGLEADAPALDGLRDAAATIASTATDTADPLAEGDPVAGDLVRVSSDGEAPATLTRLVAAVDDAGLGNPATVDHSAAAASVGEQLAPTAVTFAGDPEVGTPLMRQAPTIAIDLPLRLAVLEEAGGEVEVVHPDYADVAERHGLDVDDVAALQEAADRLSRAAAR